MKTIRRSLFVALLTAGSFGAAACGSSIVGPHNPGSDSHNPGSNSHNPGSNSHNPGSNSHNPGSNS